MFAWMATRTVQPRKPKRYIVSFENKVILTTATATF